MSIKKFVVPLCAALALGLAACGSDDDTGGADSTVKQKKGSPAQSKPVTIAFSAPGADHGWMAAITENARDAADELGDVELIAAEGVTDSAAQADQVETLIASKPDALVILPNEPDALMPVAQKAMAAGIPVIDVDREFTEQGAFLDGYDDAGNHVVHDTSRPGPAVREFWPDAGRHPTLPRWTDPFRLILPLELDWVIEDYVERSKQFLFVESRHDHFVAERHIERRFAGPRFGQRSVDQFGGVAAPAVAQAVEDAGGREPRGQFIDATEEEATRELARELGLKTGARLIRIESVRLADRA